ncbi:hypothetical protein ACFFJT_01810 [Dyella flava]|uniref:Spore coat protein U domain-containing protein n=1 Tax=Dyella flava TaxID=1920170 RepID=A0ABS2K4Y9_9GAMM|nr:hypothetical protein [Dyella flava]MBM7126266.1 hypothetical protein [Dyella flava]GLQ48930.1 hypothetical protein GCM10010872_03790 [Dyella flava]
MKSLIAATVLMVAPIAAHACASSDFAIQDVKVSAIGNGIGTRLSVKGKLVNNCSTAAAAQVRLDAKDGSGNVLSSREGWPAGTTNISPGQSVDFDLGRLLHYQADMQSYSLTVVDVRAW